MPELKTRVHEATAHIRNVSGTPFGYRCPSMNVSRSSITSRSARRAPRRGALVRSSPPRANHRRNRKRTRSRCSRLTTPESSPPLSAFYGRTAILVSAAAVLARSQSESASFVLRPAARPTEDVAATVQPRDQQGAALPQGDFQLRWTPGPAGSRYDVTVMTPEIDVVAEVENLEVTEYRVPPERLARVADRAALSVARRGAHARRVFASRRAFSP